MRLLSECYPRSIESRLMRKLGLPPVVDENTEILILGSLPGDESLAAGQYYANRKNDFWKLVGDALNENLHELTYNDKLKSLKIHRIGLWDAYYACFRRGSMDKDIAEEEPNDFAVLKSVAPNIGLICFNGGEAAGMKDSLVSLGYQTCLLPSSSPANRGYRGGRLSHWRAAIRNGAS
jgi:TDG/mug DNA glycosylase family protein